MTGSLLHLLEVYVFDVAGFLSVAGGIACSGIGVARRLPCWASAWALQFLGSGLPGFVDFVQGRLDGIHLLGFVSFLQVFQGIFDGLFLSALNLSPNSFNCFSVWKIIIGLIDLSAVSLAFLSASALASASLSSFDFLFGRPEEASMRMSLRLPVALSVALTLMILFASMSKVTSICGTPRGAGGMPSGGTVQWFCCRSPWGVLLQDADFHTGLVVGRGAEHLTFLGRDGGVGVDELVITLPMVQYQGQGVTSNRSTSFTSPVSTPPWMAAPTATTIGVHSLAGVFPKKSSTAFCTAGMRVDLLPKMISSMSLCSIPQLSSLSRKRAMVRFTKSSINCSNFARPGFHQVL